MKWKSKWSKKKLESRARFIGVDSGHIFSRKGSLFRPWIPGAALGSVLHRGCIRISEMLCLSLESFYLAVFWPAHKLHIEGIVFLPLDFSHSGCNNRCHLEQCYQPGTHKTGHHGVALICSASFQAFQRKQLSSFKNNSKFSTMNKAG